MLDEELDTSDEVSAENQVDPVQTERQVEPVQTESQVEPTSEDIQDAEYAEVLEEIEDPEVKSKVRGLLMSKISIGPYPSADELARYYDIKHDVGPQIMDATKEEQKHRHLLNKRQMDLREEQDKRQYDLMVQGLNANSLGEKRGQYLAFILSAGAFLGGGYLISQGFEISGALFSALGLVSIVRELINGRKNDKDDSGE